MKTYEEDLGTCVSACTQHTRGYLSVYLSICWYTCLSNVNAANYRPIYQQFYLPTNPSQSIYPYPCDDLPSL